MDPLKCPRKPWGALLYTISLCMWVACDVPVESPLKGHIRQLAAGGDAAEEAKNELLLTEAIDYDLLLAALEEPDLAASRANLIDVLVRLMERQEEPRILPALREHLRNDPSPEVRTRIVVNLGPLEDADLADDFLAALHDEADTVRFEAIQTLTLMRVKAHFQLKQSQARVNVSARHRELFNTELGLYGLPEHRQMTVTFDPTQTWFDVEQCRGYPTVAL